MMNEALAGRELFSDDPAYDVRWLGQLFFAAGVEQGFVVSETPARHFLELLATKHNFDSAQFLRIWQESRRDHRDRAEADALGAARSCRALRFTSLLVDTSPSASPAAERLAVEMGARYLPLPHADSAKISRAIRDAVPSEARAG